LRVDRQGTRGGLHRRAGALGPSTNPSRPTQPLSSGITVEEALARLRSRPAADCRVGGRRAHTPAGAWRTGGVKAIVVALVAAPAALGMLMVGADAIGSAPTPGASGTRPDAQASASSGNRAHGGDHRGTQSTSSAGPPAGASPTDAPAGGTGPAPSTTTTRAPGHPSGSARPSSAANAPTAVAAGAATGPTGTTTTTSTTTTTTVPPPVRAWNAQYGSILVTLLGDITAVQGATATAGDYTAVVPLWQQLATDVASAQALPAVPDATLAAGLSTALGELSMATADWLGSLTSTAPPAGTIANQAQFDAGTAQFSQGVTNFTAADAGIVAA
jgi:hypothetical protein